jgi:tetratricopeptide (TPR) repeat protein
MRLQLSTNPVGFVHESEVFFDSMFEQVLDYLKRSNQSALEIWVIFESMKQQILQVADDRWGHPRADTAHIMAYTNELLVLEYELLTSETTNEETRSILLMLLSMVYYRLGDAEKAKQIALYARREFNRLRLREQLAFTDLFLALCSLELGEWEEAGDRCVLALHELPIDKDSLGVAEVWKTYAQILHKSSHTDKAVAALLLASEIYARQGEAARQVKSILNLSLLLTGQGDWHGGIYHLKKILPLCRQQGLQTLELEVLHMLSHLFQKTGQRMGAAGCQLRISQLVSASA